MESQEKTPSFLLRAEHRGGAGSAGKGTLDAAKHFEVRRFHRGEIQLHRGDTPRGLPGSRWGKKDRRLEAALPGGKKSSAPNEKRRIGDFRACGNGMRKFSLQVSYTDEALRYSVYLSNRYISRSFCFPTRALIMTKAGGGEREVASGDGS